MWNKFGKAFTHGLFFWNVICCIRFPIVGWSISSSALSVQMLILARYFDLLHGIKKKENMQKSKIGLLLAAAAAYGAYKYSRLSPDQKQDVKTRGKDFLNKELSGVRNLFGKKKSTVNGSGY